MEDDRLEGPLCGQCMGLPPRIVLRRWEEQGLSEFVEGLNVYPHEVPHVLPLSDCCWRVLLLGRRYKGAGR